MTPTKVARLRSDLQAESSQLRAELWGLCNGFEGDGELLRVTSERDAAWARAEALERMLEMERLTARACAAEAVEIELQSEERVNQLLAEVAVAESENLRLRELQEKSESTLRDEIHKVLASLYQEELKQRLQGEVLKAKGAVPDEPCGLATATERGQVSELLEVLRVSKSELHAVDHERTAWAQRAQDLSKRLERCEASEMELTTRLGQREEREAERDAEMALLETRAAQAAQAAVQAEWSRRQTDEELCELRDVCQHLEAESRIEAFAREKPGSKLKQALREEPLASDSVPMLPPPRVIRVVEETPTSPQNVQHLVARHHEGPDESKVLQVFLDASVSEPIVPIRSSASSCPEGSCRSW